MIKLINDTTGIAVADIQDLSIIFNVTTEDFLNWFYQNQRLFIKNIHYYIRQNKNYGKERNGYDLFNNYQYQTMNREHYFFSKEGAILYAYIVLRDEVKLNSIIDKINDKFDLFLLDGIEGNSENEMYSNIALLLLQSFAVITKK